MSFDDLDPLLHSQLRLSADFTFLQEKTEATSGNLSVQISKLEEAGYLEVKKSFKGKKPNTSCSITDKGITAFENYVNTLQQYISKDN